MNLGSIIILKYFYIRKNVFFSDCKKQTVLVFSVSITALILEHILYMVSQSIGNTCIRNHHTLKTHTV